MKLRANGLARLFLALSLVAALGATWYLVSTGDLGKGIRMAIGRAAFVAGSNRFAFAEAEGFRFEFRRIEPEMDRANGFNQTTNGVDFVAATFLDQYMRPIRRGPGWNRVNITGCRYTDIATSRSVTVPGTGTMLLKMFRRDDGELNILAALPNPTPETNRTETTSSTLALLDFGAGIVRPIDLPEGNYYGAGIFDLPGTPPRVLISRAAWWTILDLETLKPGPLHPGLALQMSVLPLRDAEGQCTGFATLSRDGRYLHFMQLDGSIRWTVRLREVVNLAESPPSRRVVRRFQEVGRATNFTEGQRAHSQESTIWIYGNLTGTILRDDQRLLREVAEAVELDQWGRPLGPRQSLEGFSPISWAEDRSISGSVRPIRQGNRIRGYAVSSYHNLIMLYDERMKTAGEVRFYLKRLLNPAPGTHGGVMMPEELFQAPDGGLMLDHFWHEQVAKDRWESTRIRLRISPEPTPAAAPR